jgi:hypothetical protein
MLQVGTTGTQEEEEEEYQRCLVKAMIIAFVGINMSFSIFVGNWYFEIGYYKGSCTPLGTECGVMHLSIAEGHGVL